MARIHTVYGDDEAFSRSYKRAHLEAKPLTTEQLIKRYWNSMNSRVKKGIYLKNNIKVEWSLTEFSEWFNDNLEVFNKIKELGEVPSIDRINPKGNYCKPNCRMIPNSVNIALGEVNGLIVRMRQLQEFLKENQHWL